MASGFYGRSGGEAKYRGIGRGEHRDLGIVVDAVLDIVKLGVMVHRGRSMLNAAMLDIVKLEEIWHRKFETEVNARLGDVEKQVLGHRDPGATENAMSPATRKKQVACSDAR